MMWLTTPDADDIERLAHQLEMLPLSYEAGLLERIDAESELPRHLGGWFVDRFEAEIGHGDNDFVAARDALRRWQQFDRNWLVLADDPVPIEVDAVVAYAARVLGTWWGYGCRILRVIDEPTRFGFIYGTIQGHAERGEEVFLVQQNPDDTVAYSLLAMSRPGRWFSWPGMPIARHAQGRFRPTSANAMRRAVAATGTTPREQHGIAATPLMGESIDFHARPTQRSPNERSEVIIAGPRRRWSSPQPSTRSAGLGAMYVENDGLVAVISFYLYGLTGLSLLVLVSPLIIVALPLLIMLGPVAVAWWRGRRMAPRIGLAARWWLMAASVVVLAAPVVPGVWFLIDNTDGAPKESFWLLVFGIALLPFTLAATIHALRWQGASGPGVVGAPHSGTQ